MITKRTENNKTDYNKLFNSANLLLNAIFAIKNVTETQQTVSEGATAPPFWNNDKVTVVVSDLNDQAEIRRIATDTISQYDYEIFVDNTVYNIDNSNYKALTDPNLSTSLSIADYDDVYTDGNTYFEIDNLSDYFNVVETLSNIHPRFARLPQDEQFFEINADTRTINRPSGNNVYAVIGDHVAETIYFTIDRYYDIVDLGAEEINVFIQVSCRDKNGQEQHYLVKPTKKDLDSLPDKIIFGWPISKSITESTGTITFAVRFYVLSAQEGEAATFSKSNIEYSLGTQPITLDILNGLNYYAEDQAKIDNSAELYLKNYEKTGAIQVPAPIFIINMFPANTTGIPDEGTAYIKNSLTSANNTLTIKAKAEGANIMYYWKWIPPVTATDSEKITPAYGSAYQQVEVNSSNFATYLNNGLYIGTIPAEGESVDLSSLVRVNSKLTTIPTLEDNEAFYANIITEKTYTMDKAGTYSCSVKARSGRYSSSSGSRGVIVYGPSPIAWKETNDLSAIDAAKFNINYFTTYNSDTGKYSFDTTDQFICNPEELFVCQESDENYTNKGSIDFLYEITTGTGEDTLTTYKALDFENLPLELNDTIDNIFNSVNFNVYGRNQLNGYSTQTSDSKTYKFFKPLNTFENITITFNTDKQLTGIACTYTENENTHSQDSNSRQYKWYSSDGIQIKINDSSNAVSLETLKSQDFSQKWAGQIEVIETVGDSTISKKVNYSNL